MAAAGAPNAAPTGSIFCAAGHASAVRAHYPAERQSCPFRGAGVRHSALAPWTTVPAHFNQLDPPTADVLLSLPHLTELGDMRSGGKRLVGNAAVVSVLPRIPALRKVIIGKSPLVDMLGVIRKGGSGTFFPHELRPHCSGKLRLAGSASDGLFDWSDGCGSQQRRWSDGSSSHPPRRAPSAGRWTSEESDASSHRRRLCHLYYHAVRAHGICGHMVHARRGTRRTHLLQIR